MSFQIIAPGSCKSTTNAKKIFPQHNPLPTPAFFINCNISYYSKMAFAIGI